ncbi:MAG: hypothetical protein DWQ09_00535 [Proteobacteria bacterium]|nr:MAG: hypothetical protein DWQ09_00535 [Pseudomonadota bacterium]
MPTPDNNRREIENLLPAYVNGTLSDAECRKVDEYITQHPEVRSELEWLKALRSGMKTLPTGNAPGEMGWQRLRRELRSETETGSPSRGSAWWKPAVAAAAVIIIVQAALLAGMGPKDERFQPLSGSAGQDNVIQIQFHPGATELQIRTLLNSIDAQVVAGPGALGLYRIQVDSPEPSPQALQQALDRLREHGDVVIHASTD